MDKDKLYDLVMKGINQGCNVEIRKSKDGSLKVFKIKKEILA